MRPTRIILRMSLKSLVNAWRYDARIRTAWSVIVLIGLGVSLLSALWLARHVANWRAAGPGMLDVSLWTLMLSVWSGVVLFSAFTTIRIGISDDRAALLILQPLTPAERWRALYVPVLVLEALPRVLLLTVVPMAVLGTEAIPWLLMGLLGIAVAVLFGILATMLTLVYILPHPRASGCVASIAAVGLAAPWLVLDARPMTLPVPGAWYVSTAFLGVLVAVVGPSTGPLGRLYIAAYQRAQGRSRHRGAISLPGVRAVAGIAAHRRTASAAMVYKELLYQGRIKLNWLRLAVLFASVPVFSWVHSRLSLYEIPDSLMLAAYASGMALYVFMDASPSPIGSEGNRLSLYLVAPLDLKEYLRARLVVFLVPVLVLSVVSGVGMGLVLVLPGEDLLVTLVAIVLINIGVAAVVVWGSAWDEDLNLPVESGFQAMLQEQMPFTPRRIWILNLSALLLVAGLLVLWWFPAPIALVLLTCTQAIAVVASWCFANRYLQWLIALG